MFFCFFLILGFKVEVKGILHSQFKNILRLEFSRTRSRIETMNCKNVLKIQYSFKIKIMCNVNLVSTSSLFLSVGNMHQASHHNLINFNQLMTKNY